MNANTQLPASVAVPLAAALVQAIADHTNSQLLIVKGVAAAAQRLRQPGFSADVDAIVHPDDFPRIVAEFTRRGWRARYSPPNEIRAFPGHSVTLVHADWPCDLDLHFFFVGLFAEPSVSFQALAREREVVEVAGRPISVPSLNAHRLILAVNTVRDSGSSRAAAEATSLGQHFQANPADWEALLEIATETRSLSILRTFAVEQGLPEPEDDLNSTELRQLKAVITHHENGWGNLTYRLKDPATRPSDKIRLIFRFLYKPQQILALEQPGHVEGPRSTALANVRRWRKGLRQWVEAKKAAAPIEPKARVTEGEAFFVDTQVGELEYARLYQTDKGIVLSNAPEPVVTQSTTVTAEELLQIAERATVKEQENMFLLSLDAHFLAANPTSTPPVLCLDDQAQHLYTLLLQSPVSASDLAKTIANDFGLQESEVLPDVLSFLTPLAEAGIMKPASSSYVNR